MTTTASATAYLAGAEKRAASNRAAEALESASLQTLCITGETAAALSIAVACAKAGLETVLVEPDDASAERSAFFLERLFDGRRGGTTDETARPVIHVGLSDLPQCDVLLEAGDGDHHTRLKRATDILAGLSKSPSLLMNTSLMEPEWRSEPDTLAAPVDVAIVHFQAPAHMTRIVEVVHQTDLNDPGFAMALALAARLERIVIPVRPTRGLVANRLSTRLYEALDTLLLDGAVPWEVDEALVAFGFNIGPYEAQDLAGLDGPYYERKRLRATRDPKRRYIPVSDRMVEEGRLGKKVGVGWYRYPGGGGAVIDPLLEDLITEEAHFARVTRRTISADEVCSRVVAALVNEAAAILHEGIVARPSDIDLVAVHALGFPAERGGILFHANEVGLGEIIKDLSIFAQEDPVAWAPSPLLIDLAKTGKALLAFGLENAMDDKAKR